MTKKITALILVIMLIFTFTNKTYAFGGGYPAEAKHDTSDSSPGSPNNLDGNGTNSKRSGDANGKRYECYYSQSIGYSNSFSVNAYDLSGESIIPYGPVPTKYVKAGTWVGINATETSFASWAVDNFHIYEIKKNYRCKWHREGTTVDHWINADSCKYPYYKVGTAKNGCTTSITVHGITHSFTYDCEKCYYRETINGDSQTEDFLNRDYYESFICDGKPGYTMEQEELPETKQEIYSDPIDCKSNAANTARTAAESKVSTTTTTLEYLQETINPETKKTELQVKKLSGILDSNKSSTHNYGDHGDFTRVYSFEPEKVCFNLKSAQIKYGNCTIDDYTIELKKGTVFDEYLNEQVSYWHYFIPLTAKTTSDEYNNDDAYIKMYRTAPLDFSQCENGMKSPNYENLIAPQEGNYIGDYGAFGTNSMDYQKLQADNKCYFATSVNFKVKQEFYNEISNKETSKKMLRGYGSYFRQINVNDPFPNGLSANSYWKDFYDSSNSQIVNLKTASGQNIDASAPFSNLSYKVYLTNNKIKEIKAFNKDESASGGVYTSWEAMSKSGISRFVNNYVERNINTNSFYKLGCGPANKDWEECK